MGDAASRDDALAMLRKAAADSSGATHYHVGQLLDQRDVLWLCERNLAGKRDQTV